MGTLAGASEDIIKGILSEIKETGYGSEIHYALKRNKEVDAAILAEYIYIEHTGQNIRTQIQAEFGPTNILEHYQCFFRYKIVQNHKLQDMFGYFENNKEKLNII